MCNDSSCWQIGWELTVRQILQQHEPSGINGPLVLFAKVFINNLPLKTWKLTIARHDSSPILAIHTFQSPQKTQTIKLLDTSVVSFLQNSVDFPPFRLQLHWSDPPLRHLGLAPIYFGCHRVYHRCFLYMSNRGQDFRFTSTSNQGLKP